MGAGWTVSTLNAVVDAEIAALPGDIQARFLKIAELIEVVGLDHVGEPHVKRLEGKLWEMRMSGRDGIARALYVVVTGRRVIVVRAFVKKTQRTPRREIDLASTRAKDLIP